MNDQLKKELASQLKELRERCRVITIKSIHALQRAAKKRKPWWIWW